MVSYKCDLEAVILGSILVEINAFTRINTLRASCFNNKNKIVFEAIRKVYESNKNITILSVGRQVLLDINVGYENEKEQYSRISQYLISLSSKVCSTSNLEYQFLSLIELSLREEFISELNLLIKQLKQVDLELYEDFVFTRKKLLEFSCNPWDILNNLCFFLEKNYPFESEKYQSILDLATDFNQYSAEVGNNLDSKFKLENIKCIKILTASNNELEHWPDVNFDNKGPPSKNNYSKLNQQELNQNDLPF